MKKQIIIAILFSVVLATSVLVVINILRIDKPEKYLVLKEKQVTNLQSDAGIYDLSWSPDGKKIAFVTASTKGTLNIWTIDSNGTNQKRLTIPEKNAHSPCWSPDGKKIAFVLNRDGGASIWIMNSNGSNQAQLSPSKISAWDPCWSSWGEKIIYVSHNIVPLENWIPTPYEIWTMNSDGTDQKQLIGDMRGKRNPCLSPDDNKIIFIATAVEMLHPEIYDTQEELWIMNKDGTDQKPLLKPGRTVESVIKASWTPDSEKIFVEFYGNNNYGLSAINSNGNKENIIAMGQDIGNFSLSPNGKKISFVREGEIWVMDNDGSNRKKLTKSEKNASGPHWSPDGKKIAFTKKNEIWVIELK